MTLNDASNSIGRAREGIIQEVLALLSFSIKNNTIIR